MPRVVDYPRASLRRSLDLAQVIEDLGGEASIESAAEQMGNKVGGAFKALVGAAVKYGLINAKGGRLQVSQSFKDHVLAYSDEERRSVERRAFLSVPLFTEVTSKFSGKKLPVDYFEKLLVREFGVPTEIGSRVAGYYMEGARSTGVLNEAGVVQGDVVGGREEGDVDVNSDSAAPTDVQAGSRDTGRAIPVTPTAVASRPEKYHVRIYGPDLDSTIEITDEDDLAIVEVMIKKVRRLIGSNQ